MNCVQLLGNLGADAELRDIGNGNSVLNFSLATTEKWSKDGETKEKTQWHRCSIFGKRAEGLAPHLKKGTKIAVQGSIDYREYEKDGEKRYATNIKVFDVHFAGGKKNDSASADSAPASTGADYTGAGDEDLPF